MSGVAAASPVGEEVQRIVAYFPRASTCLATFGHTVSAMEPLARILLGERAPHGRLPVAIPAAADPSTILYPYGHGLTGQVNR